MANDEFRDQQQAARTPGLKARHETRVERAMDRAVKDARAAVRAEVAEEIAAAIERWFPDPHEPGEHCADCWLIQELAHVAREIGAKETSRDHS